MFGDYLKELYENVVLKYGIDKIPFDDPIYTYSILLNSKRYIFCKTLEFNKVRKASKNGSYEPLSKINTIDYDKTMKFELSSIKKFIFEKYNKTYNDIINNIIVSLTSYKDRLKYVPSVIDSILKNTIKPYKICLTLAQSDTEYITKELQNLIDTNTIELIIADEDLRPHNKYFYVMQKYRNNPIITIDDDLKYDNKLIENLLNSYNSYPYCISAYRTHRKTYDKNNMLLSYEKWNKYERSINTPSNILFATGVGGVLYPPNILKVNDSWLPVIKEFITVDDIVLNYYEITSNIPVVYCKNSFMTNNNVIKDSQNTVLWKENIKNGNNRAINLLLAPAEFEKIVENKDIMSSLEQDRYKEIISSKKYIKQDSEKYKNTKNQNLYDSTTLIVSMTSWPKRIQYVYDAFVSILNQSISLDKYKCVLVLSKLEFPNKEKDLPIDLIKLIENNWIELIWTEDNIKSHKKLIPTLEKYPDNPILIVDDDVYRNYDYIERFYCDYLRHPNNIICGSTSYMHTKDSQMLRVPGLNNKNNIPSIILNNIQPANGLGGVLYPPHTFTNKVFFDRELFMRLTPSSDELWQFCFNIMQNNTLRHLSKVYNNEINLIKDSQNPDRTLYTINKKNYSQIINSLCEYFVDFKKKLRQ